VSQCNEQSSLSAGDCECSLMSTLRCGYVEPWLPVDVLIHGISSPLLSLASCTVHSS